MNFLSNEHKNEKTKRHWAHLNYTENISGWQERRQLLKIDMERNDENRSGIHWEQKVNQEANFWHPIDTRVMMLFGISEILSILRHDSLIHSYSIHLVEFQIERRILL